MLEEIYIHIKGQIIWNEWFPVARIDYLGDVHLPTLRCLILIHSILTYSPEHPVRARQQLMQDLQPCSSLCIQLTLGGTCVVNQ